MKSTLIYFGAWMSATSVAVALSIAAPSESSVMGRFPSFMSYTLMRQPVVVPSGLPSERTLALITFQRSQHVEADSWIHGLNLKNDASIAWVRMPVLNDPGTPSGRNAVETRLLGHYPSDTERAKLMPVFTDRASFVRSAGLNGVDHFYAVVVNRKGDVLARVEGQFDPDKAKTLRETLLTSN